MAVPPPPQRCQLRRPPAPDARDRNSAASRTYRSEGLHSRGACVVGEPDVLEAIELPPQVRCSAEEVRGGVPWIDGELRGGPWHPLHQADRPRGADRGGMPCGLDAGDGSDQARRAPGGSGRVVGARGERQRGRGWHLRARPNAVSCPSHLGGAARPQLGAFDERRTCTQVLAAHATGSQKGREIHGPRFPSPEHSHRGDQ